MKNVNEMMYDYALYVGLTSIEEDGESKFTPRMYMEGTWAHAELPKKEVASEFLTLFYEAKEVEDILNEYYRSEEEEEEE